MTEAILIAAIFGCAYLLLRVFAPRRERDVVDEAVRQVDRRAAAALRTADTRADGGLDGDELGIGAATLPPYPSQRSGRGPRHLGRQYIRVVSPPKRLVRGHRAETKH